MSTDKTLADVQPGGRVGLGDQPPFVFARFVNGVRMAEGVTIEKERNLADAMQVAAKVASKGPNGETPVLVHVAALSAQPSPGGQGDDSPMAKMAAALRRKAEAERAAFDQRVQSGEWGPMPDNPDVLELPPLPEEVDSVRCMIRGEKAFAEPCDCYFTSKQMRDYARAALAARQPVGLRLILCRDSYPPLVAHSSSYGGIWTSDWCLVVDLNGSACSARYQVSDFDKRSMDANGGVPNAVQNDPWRVPGFGRVVAWAKASDVVAHISRSADAAPPAQAVDLGKSIPSELAPVAAALKRLGLDEFLGRWPGE